MNSTTNQISEIIQKYDKEELLLNKLLDEKIQAEQSKHTCLLNKNYFVKTTYDEAKKRNGELLKHLELVKARLRSKAIFTPAELKWDDICKKYQQNPSLNITSWRCHLSPFV